MIGRAAIGYPWIFNEIKHYFETGRKLALPSLEDRINIARQHLDFSVRWKGERQGIFEMRRHYTNYFRGLHGFKPFRTRLVESNTQADILANLEEVDKKYS